MFRATAGTGTAEGASALFIPVSDLSSSPVVLDLNIKSGGSPLVLDPADDIFREALEGHKLGLSSSQQNMFLGASAVGLLDIVKELDQQHTVESRTRRSIVKTQAFLKVADGYLNVLGIFIQHSPHYSALLVGGLKLFVDVSRNGVLVMINILISCRLEGDLLASSTSWAKRWSNSVPIWTISPSLRNYMDTMWRLRR